MLDVVVVGGGLCGLTAAFRLTRAGYRVAVLERQSEPGGLVRTVAVGGERLEQFYHHLFTSDRAYLRLAEELGLADDIEWLPSRMGIWTDGRLWDFGTPMALARFRPLPWIDKVRFALSTLLLQRVRSPERFETVTAREWLSRHQGPRVWRYVWGPLFEQKFGRYAPEIAMVWLWGKLRLRGTSRSSSGMGEQLGYMRGSFGRLVDALCERIASEGGRLALATNVTGVGHREDGFAVRTEGEEILTRRVLLTTPVDVAADLAETVLQEEDVERLRRLRSTAAMCTVLEMKRSLTPYYWLNVADPELPFGGLIEHTNYVPRSRYGDRHVLYISKYVPQDDPLVEASRDRLLDHWFSGLRKINPEFSSSWVVGAHHFRARSGQPVVTPGYRELLPGIRSRLPGLYMATMSQIYPEDRGQNYAVDYGRRAAELIAADAERDRPR